MYSTHLDRARDRARSTPAKSAAVVCCCPVMTPLGWVLVWRVYHAASRPSDPAIRSTASYLETTFSAN